jgi:hypothetical protein
MPRVNGKFNHRLKIRMQFQKLSVRNVRCSICWLQDGVRRHCVRFGLSRLGFNQWTPIALFWRMNILSELVLISWKDPSCWIFRYLIKLMSTVKKGLNECIVNFLLFHCALAWLPFALEAKRNGKKIWDFWHFELDSILSAPFDCVMYWQAFKLIANVCLSWTAWIVCFIRLNSSMLYELR